MHTRFEATVVHETERGAQSIVAKPVQNPDEILIEDDEDEQLENAASTQPPLPTTVSKQNPDEIVLDDEEEVVEAPPPPPAIASETKFLALDKCLPGRKFLEVSYFIY